MNFITSNETNLFKATMIGVLPLWFTWICCFVGFNSWIFLRQIKFLGSWYKYLSKSKRSSFGSYLPTWWSNLSIIIISSSGSNLIFVGVTYEREELNLYDSFCSVDGFLYNCLEDCLSDYLEVCLYNYLGDCLSNYLEDCLYNYLGVYIFIYLEDFLSSYW